jgi:hypothetical protein
MHEAVTMGTNNALTPQHIVFAGLLGWLLCSEVPAHGLVDKSAAPLNAGR